MNTSSWKESRKTAIASSIDSLQKAPLIGPVPDVHRVGAVQNTQRIAADFTRKGVGAGQRAFEHRAPILAQSRERGRGVVADVERGRRKTARQADDRLGRAGA